MDLSPCKILVVGAGGIGCELLKNLVLSGCKFIHVVDLDTIEFSNLNRQFLFRREHVGKPKAQVASETVKAFGPPDLEVQWHHKNITDSEFDVNFYKQFDFVLNALDNRAARNHVNRLCLATDIYLIESGSAGYLGQTTVIKKGVTECYECQAKAPPKSYPACTIRNTPSEPIHCIVWAKHLFNQLFGEVDPDEDVSPDLNDTEISSSETPPVEENKNGNSHSDISQSLKISTRKWVQDNGYDPEALFTKLYDDDIRYLLSMSNLWKKRSPPIALNAHILTEHDGNVQDCNTSLAIEDQRLWTLIKCKSVFTECVTELKRRFDSSKSGDFLIWDKDDGLSMDFVTACANLRSFAFHIPLKSRFEIKSMAGNIIPAIATTNAVVAGLIVMELWNLHNRKFSDCTTTYLLRKPNHKGKYFVKCALFHPNPKCYVCSEKSEVFVKLNTEQFTVQSLEEKILKQHLHMVAPDVEIDDNKGTIIISSEKGEICGLDNKTLSSLNVNDGTRLNCDDFKQHFVLRLVIANSCDLNNDEFEIQTDTSQIQPKVEEPSSSKKALEEDDITEIVETTADHISEMKRKSAAAVTVDDEEISTKRPRVA